MAKEGQPALETITGSLGRGVRGSPPVELWNPPYCGDLDMRIATDGTWIYLKTPIGRPALVKLFASVLKREGDRYFLVTPVEKCGIQVDDAPFLAVELKVEDRRRRARFAFPHQCRRLGHLRAGAQAAFRAGSRNRRSEALSSRPPRSMGQSDPRPVLRSGRAGRGTRHRRHRHVRGVVRGRILSDGAGASSEGIRVNDRAANMQHAAADDFFRRARARLTLEMPPALTDPTMEGARGDLDLESGNVGARGRQAHQARRRARSRDRSVRADGPAHAAHCGACQPRRPSGLSRRQNRSRRRISGRGGFA